MSARITRQALSIGFGWAGIMFLLAQGWHAYRGDPMTLASLALDAAIWSSAGLVFAYVLTGYLRRKERQG